jgi:hypothetical protein
MRAAAAAAAAAALAAPATLPPSLPIRCECETVIVAGAEDLQPTRMDTFIRTSLTTLDGRSMYQNSDSQYLYYWPQYSDWQISPDYLDDTAWVTSTSSNAAVCPTAAFG